MARERAIANQLARILGAANLPIYAVDHRRHIAYCNTACADWLGVAVEELVGQRCDYTSADSGDPITDLAARLCPPPEAFSGESSTIRTELQGSGKDDSIRAAECIRLVDGDGESVGVFVVVREANDTSLPPNDVASAQQLHLRLQQLVLKARMPFRLDRLVGTSLAISRVRQQARIAIETRTNVQIVGPTGSGREHLGRTIHNGEQPEHAGPLMPLACSLLDGELLQATVVAFLHRAKEADPAHPATLLLLEADRLSSTAQAELLAFFRVPTFELRTVVTTCEPLVRLADAEDCFLPELAYRLSTMTIELPAIDKRREDLPLLCQRFLEDFNARGDKQLSGFAARALDQLCSLPWNGNVEELQQVVCESCEQAAGPVVTEADLARRVKLVTSAAKHPIPTTETIKLDDFLLDVEKELLQRAMQSAKGNKSEAARLLGISRARVIRRVAQLASESPATQKQAGCQ